MKKVIVDNFFGDPDEVRSYALSLSYRKRNDDEFFEGLRSPPLHLLDRRLYEKICNKVISEYYGTDRKFAYEAYVYFHKTSIEDREDPNWTNINERVHTDDMLTAAIIYLTPNAPMDCGTQTYQRIENKFVPDIIMSNRYNRMISYSGAEYHSAMDFFGSGDDSRLVVLFFLKKFIVQE
jgi:hypothetical protein